MIRNLKAMLLAALAVTALAALSASVAQAAERFTALGAGAAGVTTLKTLKDGTGKTAHFVFDIENAAGTSKISYTCTEVIADTSVVGEEQTEARFSTLIFGGHCETAGQTITITNTGCDFIFTAHTQLHIVNESGKVCAHGQQPIDLEFPGCKIEFGAQTVNGINYHNVTGAGVTVGNNEGNTITVEMSNLTGITYNAKGLTCEFGTTHNGTFTTGNFYITGERPVGSGTMVDVRWDSV